MHVLEVVRRFHDRVHEQRDDKSTHACGDVHPLLLLQCSPALCVAAALTLPWQKFRVVAELATNDDQASDGVAMALIATVQVLEVVGRKLHALMRSTHDKVAKYLALDGPSRPDNADRQAVKGLSSVPRVLPLCNLVTLM
jgi:hypothetical protein